MIGKNRILIIGHNFSPEPTGIGKYSGEMAEWLVKNGYDCTVITTFPYYPHWKVQLPYKNRWYKKEIISYPGYDEKLTVYRCPLYVPKNPTGRKRMAHDFSFWVSKLMMIIKLILFNKSFNYVITIAPPFHLGYLSRLYRKVRGGKLVYHIQDLQIDAAQKLNQLKGEQLFNLLFKAERVMLKGSDYVSTISDGMIKTIKTKLDRPIILFPNWADTSIFFPIKDKAGLKRIWGYRKDQLICLYSGSIGEKQGLENVINAAEILKNVPKIQFIICGTGPHKTKLQKLALKKQLKNVTFLPLQNRDILNEFLNMADIHLIMQKAYVSDLVMPSKLFTILATGGVSLVTTVTNTSLHDLVNNFDVGFTVPPDDYCQLAEIIKSLPGKDLNVKQENSRAYALKYLNIDNVMNKFMEDIFPR